MDFMDQLHLLANNIEKTREIIQTEEATKTTMIMPFIQALGYNVFDPLEVTPELVADVGIKKGEKVDYAILRDGKPIILFECKKCSENLNGNHASQLSRYFHVTEARFAILTNGIVYRFFSDLEKPNKMDEKPFFEFNILDFKERDIEELKKFAKVTFNLDTILSTANDLKYTRAIQMKLAEWMVNPSEDFVRLLSADLRGSRQFTQAVKDQFTILTKRAFEQFINERINQRLKGAMTPELKSEPQSVEVEGSQQEVGTAVVTTDQEVEGFYTVRAIVREIIPTQRIFMRDAQSYCAILLDDNNRKPICRLRFNNTQKLKLGLFNTNKEEEQVAIDSVDEIFNYAEQIRATVASYVEDNQSSSS